MNYHISVKPQEVRDAVKDHVMPDRMDMVMDLEKSHGAYVYDSLHNRELLDFFSCFATIPLGYNHPKMLNDEEFKRNLLMAALINPSNSDVFTTQFAQFVKTFARVAMPDYLPHTFFIAGGALAVENALKVAMDWKVQKNIVKGYRPNQEFGTKVLHFVHAFHGRTGYTLSLTNTQPDKIRYFAKFEDWPRVQSPMIRFPYTDENYEDLLRRERQSVEQIKQAFRDHRDEICAIIIEPIQSEGGDNHFRKEFMEQLRVLCDENEALLIYDEVQTGVGLTGTFWAHEQFGEFARPDLVAFGKKMQICGILGGGKVDDVPENCFRVPSRINSTWGGNLVDMVRCERILQIIEEDNVLDHVKHMGEHLLSQLYDLQSKHPHLTNVRGRGLICAFDLPTSHQRDHLIKLGLEHNVLLLGAGPRSIRFRPTLTIEQSDIDHGISILDRVLTVMGL
jgi:L-lysine 6-transaminase